MEESAAAIGAFHSIAKPSTATASGSITAAVAAKWMQTAARRSVSAQNWRW